MPFEQTNRRDALAPQTVVRDYTIEAVLGHGGFGIVYRARHNDLGHLVAIKEYLPVDLALREENNVVPRSLDCAEHYWDGLRRFRDEAKALISLSYHPNIIACRDFFRGNGTAYLVMDFVDGQPLSRILRDRESERRPLSEADLLAVAVPLAEGLAHVHRAGLLHRDVKPANILIRRDDQCPVLIDFGAAKHSFADSTKSLAPYTDGYAAQEQVANGKLGPWTDMYGYGGVLWRMVAGGNPVGHQSGLAKVESRMNARLSGDTDPLYSARELGADRFSERILKVIDKCLELDSNERFRDSGEAVAILTENIGTAKESASPRFGECSESFPENPRRFQPMSSGAAHPSESSPSRPVEVEGLLDTTVMANVLTYILVALICLSGLKILGVWTVIRSLDAGNTIPNWLGILSVMTGFIYDTIFLVALIIFLKWTYHSSCNAHLVAAYEGRELRYSPIWAVGSYFVPIASLWKPFQPMKEILTVFEPESPPDRINSNGPSILPIWWTLWVSSNLFAILTFAIMIMPILAPTLANSLVSLGHLITASSGVTCIILVRTLREWQTTRTSHWSLGQAHWGLVLALSLIGIAIQLDSITGLDGILGPTISLQLLLVLTSWMRSLFFLWPILFLLGCGALVWLSEVFIFLPIRTIVLGYKVNDVADIRSYLAEYVMTYPIATTLSIIASIVSLGTLWTGVYLLLLVGIVLLLYGGRVLWKSIA